MVAVCWLEAEFRTAGNSDGWNEKLVEIWERASVRLVGKRIPENVARTIFVFREKVTVASGRQWLVVCEGFRGGSCRLGELGTEE